MPVIIPNGNDRRSSTSDTLADRRSNTSDTLADRTDQNLGTRITNFNSIILQKLCYRIPLKYFVDLGLLNFPKETDTKFIFTLESNMNKLFESNAKITT